jgi:Protein of unknown function (DUF3574)
MIVDRLRSLTQFLPLAGWILIGSFPGPVQAQKRPELLLPPVTPESQVRQTHSLCQPGGAGAEFTKTELYFGLSKADGATISDAEFERFVDQTVTPRFPAGLTWLTAIGQFRSAQGTLVREASRLLILLYPLGDRDSHLKIEAIRSDYRRTFQQESVLRVDSQTCAAF